jgi:hypothetical protein
MAAGGTVIAAMLVREWRLGSNHQRMMLIVTDSLGMVLVFQLGLWWFAVVSLNHWLTAIGLASHIQKRFPPYIFAVGLMAGGLVFFCTLFVNFATGALYFTVTAVGLRLSLGFVHFLYDRWVYKFSDPQVRATIGRDLFTPVPVAVTE